MAIEKMPHHYSFENPASVYDEEAMTALELAGRQGKKINEVIEDQNNLRRETEEHLEQQDTNIEHIRTVTVPDDVNKQLNAAINDGRFNETMNEYMGDLHTQMEMLDTRLDNFQKNTPSGSTSMDTEVIDIRVDNLGVTHASAGEAVREQTENIINVTRFMDYKYSLGLIPNTAINSSTDTHVDGFPGRTAMKHQLKFPHDVDVTCDADYSLILRTYNGGEMVYTKTKYRAKIPANTNFRLEVDSNDTSVSFDDILSHISVSLYGSAVNPLAERNLTPTKTAAGNVTAIIKKGANGEFCLRTDVAAEVPAAPYMSLEIGNYGELKGKTIVLKRIETHKSKTVVVSFGTKWAGNDRTKPVIKYTYDDCMAIDLDETFKQVLTIANKTIDENYTGAVYLFIYDIENGGTAPMHNRYKVFCEETPIFNQYLYDSIGEIKKMGNVLYGKKYVASGDSFTEGTFAQSDYPDGYDEAGQKKTYAWHIANRNNMTLVKDGISGSTLADCGREYTFSVDRYKNIPADADYLTIWFGINDSHQKVPIGNINDTTNKTFYGAWNVVFEYLLTNYPNLKIGVIASNGCDTTDYPLATINACRKWGIPYLDLNGDYNVPLMHRVTGKTEVCEKAQEIMKARYWVSDTDGHPNPLGHYMQSTFIEDFLRRL